MNYKGGLSCLIYGLGMVKTEEYCLLKWQARGNTALDWLVCIMKVISPLGLYQFFFEIDHPSKRQSLPSQKLRCPNIIIPTEIKNTYDTNIYWTFHPTVAEYSVSSSAHGIFYRIEHMLCHKTSLSKYKELIQRMFHDHSGMKLEINNI